MPIAHLRGIDITYRLGGEGPRLLFISGTGSSLRESEVLFAPFVDHVELLAHDQRALGDTTIPDLQPTMADYAADAAALAEHVGWDTYRVIGISFGGMVAQELAVTWPERVERLALLCTSPGGTGPDGQGLSSYPLHELADVPVDERIRICRHILDTRFTDAWLADHPTDAFIADVFEQRTRAPRSDEQRRGDRLQLEARRHHDVLDRLGAITSPTLVAAGRFDGIAPLSNAEAIVERVPDAELRTYDGGHAFFFQDPAALPDVVEFLITP